MNFLLDKAEHQEVPHYQQQNAQANLLQTQAAAVMENQPMWRPQMAIPQQSVPDDSQTGKNITLKNANAATFLIGT